MDKFSALAKGMPSDQHTHVFDRLQIAEALNVAEDRHKSLKASRWDEKLSHLGHALVDLWQADPGIIHVALEHFEWLTARAASKTGLRRGDVLSRAKSDFEKVARNAFQGVLLSSAYDALFEGHAGAGDFVKAMERSIDLWEVKNDAFPEQAEALRRSTDLLYEIAWFGHSLWPSRPSRIDARRTTRTTNGQSFCELCFRPSHRYRIYHSLRTSKWAFENRAQYQVLFSGRPAPLSFLEAASADEACSDYCDERHRIRLSEDERENNKREGKKGKNDITRRSDDKLPKRAAFKHELKNLGQVLKNLKLGAPRSLRLKRMVAWYRCHPGLAKKELLPRLAFITANRSMTEMVVNRVLQDLAGTDRGETAFSDDVLHIEIWAIGAVKVVLHDGSVKFITKPGSDDAFRHLFDQCMVSVLNLLDIGREHLTGFDVAVFEDLGVELQISTNLIRFVFESPTWLRLVCGLRAKGTC